MCNAVAAASTIEAHSSGSEGAMISHEMDLRSAGAFLAPPPAASSLIGRTASPREHTGMRRSTGRQATINRVPPPRVRASRGRRASLDKWIECRRHAYTGGIDAPEIFTWTSPLEVERMMIDPISRMERPR